MKKGLSIIGIPLIALVMLPVAQAYSNEVVDPEGAVAPDEAITIEVAVEENEVVDERGIFKKIGDAWKNWRAPAEDSALEGPVEGAPPVEAEVITEPNNMAEALDRAVKAETAIAVLREEVHVMGLTLAEAEGEIVTLIEQRDDLLLKVGNQQVQVDNLSKGLGALLADHTELVEAFLKFPATSDLMK